MNHNTSIRNDGHQPRGNNIYWKSNSGWGRPDIITTTRRYRYITVDYKYQTGGLWRHEVISHAYYRNLVKENRHSVRWLREISDEYCLDPITVAHPFMKSLDSVKNDGNTYTVLLHQETTKSEKLEYAGYYEILDDSERDLPFSQRKRWILDPIGRLLEGGISGKNVKTPKH